MPSFPRSTPPPSRMRVLVVRRRPTQSPPRWGRPGAMSGRPAMPARFGRPGTPARFGRAPAPARFGRPASGRRAQSSSWRVRSGRAMTGGPMSRRRSRRRSGRGLGSLTSRLPGRAKGALMVLAAIVAAVAAAMRLRSSSSHVAPPT